MLDVNGIDLYYGAAQALRGVSLRAEPGKVTCVLGRNGVGKTSLLRALAGQQSLSRGCINWENADITRLRPFERARRGIAYVPQGRDIFPLLSVEENLKTGFAPLPRQRRVIPDDVFSLFPVLSDMLSRRGGDLSGGQQQQLAIARALVMQPRLLLLDEPTEGIQPSVIKDIGSAIRYLRSLGQMAIVLVEQYLDFAQELGDSFAVMDRGAIVFESNREGMDEGALRRALVLRGGGTSVPELARVITNINDVFAANRASGSIAISTAPFGGRTEQKLFAKQAACACVTQEPVLRNSKR